MPNTRLNNCIAIGQARKAHRRTAMMIANGRHYQQLARDTFQPVSEMLDNGQCEPAKAAVHGVLMATATVCATYNIAAWIKRRQRHLLFNAVVYSAAVVWEWSHIVHHLQSCPEPKADPAPSKSIQDAA
jgi:hypothetical protein